MKRNIGTAERIIRFIVAAVLGVFYYFQIVTGAIAMIFLTISVFSLITSIVPVCPVYKLLGYSSRWSGHNN